MKALTAFDPGVRRCAVLEFVGALRRALGRPFLCAWGLPVERVLATPLISGVGHALEKRPFVVRLLHGQRGRGRGASKAEATHGTSRNAEFGNQAWRLGDGRQAVRVGWARRKSYWAVSYWT